MADSLPSNFDTAVLETKTRRLHQLINTLYEAIEPWVRDNDVKADEFVKVLASSAARAMLAAGHTDEKVTELMAMLTRIAINMYRGDESAEASALVNSRAPSADAGAN